MAPPAALALDLGTTRIKLGELEPDGSLRVLGVADAPRPAGLDLVREVDPLAWRAAVESLLSAAPLDPGAALGIASQRSSFLLFAREDGAPRTPLISWQDRRAAPWCEAHAVHEPRIRELTGLPLSPHYAGPKLATLLRAEPALAAGLRSGALLFGTLETWLAHGWSGGRHLTDLSMAARTQMVDVRDGSWSRELLELFGVPRAALPRLVDSAGRALELDSGLRLAASVADQGAGLLAALGDASDAALVNLGTGGFVLRPTGSRYVPLAGYLAGPAARLGGAPRHALEGTINGGGATVDGLADGPTGVPASDPAPEGFCLPDENGVGAPHWRPTRQFTFSEPAELLEPFELRRIALEGLLFRVREILDDLGRDGGLRRVVLSGGLANDPFVQLGLAALFDGPVELLMEPEATLLGAARLAAGRERAEPARTRRIARPDGLSWLRAKYPRWKAWLAALLAS